MKRIIPIIGALSVISGCSSTSDVERTGPDSYVISGFTAAPFARGASVKSRLYDRANKYCEEKGEIVETKNVTFRNQIPFVRPYADSELEFNCVNEK